MSSVQLDQINVVTPDVQALVQFLRGMDVEIADMPPEWMDHHRRIESTVTGLDAELDSAAFAAHWGALPPGWTGVVLILRVADRSSVDALYERAIAAGAVSRRDPYDAFWGARSAFIEAPGGTIFGIASPIDPHATSIPPDPSTFV